MRGPGSRLAGAWSKRGRLLARLGLGSQRLGHECHGQIRVVKRCAAHQGPVLDLAGNGALFDCSLAAGELVQASLRDS